MSLFDLEAGMVLDQDLYDNKGILLAPLGQVLNESMVLKLQDQASELDVLIRS